MLFTRGTGDASIAVSLLNIENLKWNYLQNQEMNNTMYLQLNPTITDIKRPIHLVCYDYIFFLCVKAQVTRRYKIVAEEWARASNPDPDPMPPPHTHTYKKKTLKHSFYHFSTRALRTNRERDGLTGRWTEVGQSFLQICVSATKKMQLNGKKIFIFVTSQYLSASKKKCTLLYSCREGTNATMYFDCIRECPSRMTRDCYDL